jgi:hypothetical protein
LASRTFFFTGQNIFSFTFTTFGFITITLFTVGIGTFFTFFVFDSMITVTPVLMLKPVLNVTPIMESKTKNVKNVPMPTVNNVMVIKPNVVNVKLNMF